MSVIEHARVHRGRLGPKGLYGGLAPISEDEELMQNVITEREGRFRRWGTYATISALCGALVVVGVVFRSTADDAATSLGSADLVAKARYEHSVQRLGLVEGHVTQSAGEPYDSLPFNSTHGECAFEKKTCDKYYGGTFQYVDSDCTYGEAGGIGCVVNQGCRFCRLIRRVAFTEDERNAEAAGAPVEPYTPRDLELNWCPPCVCEQYGVEGCAGLGYIGPFV